MNNNIYLLQYDINNIEYINIKKIEKISI